MAKHAGRCSRSPGWSRAGTGDHILDFVKSILYHRFSRVLLHQGLACPGALVALQEALLVLDPLFLVLEDQLLMVDLFLDLSTVGCQVLSCILSKIYPCYKICQRRGNGCSWRFWRSRRSPAEPARTFGLPGAHNKQHRRQHGGHGPRRWHGHDEQMNR